MRLVNWCKHHCFSLGLLFAFLLPFLAFSRSLIQDFSPIDDSFLIVNNPIVHTLDWTHLKLAFTTFDPELYIPLTLLSFQIDWLIGSGSPAMFHLTNLLLQGLNTVLVGVFVFFLLRGKDSAKGIALSVALLFAVHPLHTEAVVWSAGRKDLLSTFFFLASAILFMFPFSTSVEKGVGDEGARRNVLYFLSLLVFLFGLLSKVLIATLPAILILLVFLRRTNVSAKRMVLTLVPFFLLSGIFLYVALFGKERIIGSSTLFDTAIMAQKSAFFYLEKILFPIGLTVIYPFQGTITLASSEFLLPLIINLALIISALWLWKKRPMVSFGILFFFITLLPTFFNFHKGSFLFFAVDRYAYVPSIGLLLSLVLVSAEFSDMFRLSRYVRVSVLIVVLTVFTSLSVRQTLFWDSPETLFTHAIDLYPESVSARTALGSVMRERGQLAEAFQVLHDGARYSDHPELNYQAGLVYASAGQVDDARTQFHLALSKDPNHAPAMNGLGALDEHDGKIASAMDWYQKAISADPSFVGVRVHLARMLLSQKKYSEAFDQLSMSYKWNPVSIETIDALIDLETLRKNESEVERWKALRERLE